MNTYVESIYDKNKDIFGLPQRYKNIDFFPVKMKEIEIKHLFYHLFFHPKNYIPDKEIIKMSYLKFLFYIIHNQYESNNTGVDIRKGLIKFLQHITRCDKVKYGYVENGKLFDITIEIGDEIFHEYEFDNLREIILEQNGSSIEYVEEYNVSLEEKMAFINHQTDNFDAKDEMYSFCSLTHMLEEDVGERTLYQFKCRFEREMLLKEYGLFKPLEVSGQVSSKSGGEIFKHYLSHIPKATRYGNILIDKDKFLESSGLGNADKDGNINA